MSPTDLTPRQREILALVEDSIARRGMPPTRAEIAQALGYASANAAQEHLRALARKGTITLVYSAHDEEHNDAVVLRQLILRSDTAAQHKAGQTTG